jgi:hypothetical protein
MQASFFKTLPPRRLPSPRMAAVIILMALAGSFTVIRSVESAATKRSVETKVEQTFGEDKQGIFNAVHPLGTATSVEVKDLKIFWKKHHLGRSLNDVAEYTVRFTLHWKSPLIADGYTNLTDTFDTTSQKWVQLHLIDTNGTTNDEALTGALNVFGALWNSGPTRQDTEDQMREHQQNQYNTDENERLRNGDSSGN